MIYLDNSATTKPYPSVLKSFQEVSERFFSNPSSIHQFGGEAEKLLLKAREQAAQLLNVLKEEIVFTSGGTEGNNMAIKGIALQHQSRGKHIITTQIEHPSIIEACESLETLGFDVTYLPVDENGVVSVTDVEQAIRPDTILISIMHVNNELGSIQPIKAIADIAKRYPKLFFHVDNVQGVGKVHLDLQHEGINLCSISAHKIHGLKGTGILYVQKGTTLFSLLHGGGQENSIRSGTENLAGIVSMVKALRLVKEKELMIDEMYQLQQYLRSQLEEMAKVVVNTPREAAPHIMNFSVPGLKPEVIIHMLGKHEIYISTRSACSSKNLDESHVLAACGHDKKRTTAALRVSFGYETTKEELDTFVQVLKNAIMELKEVME
ncbi:cysteine desulfurase family protein [Oceanobacillus halotolerans]|uniref:cysteine desulfurase family protein n=1 Tax=Oceanobacillus halotolerans TaxID=2663380 RepID=UPI0013D9061C|nr:cysteine desulfurase family protein [Oceanobacillus halotolerans]